MGWGRGRVGQKRGRKKKETDGGTSDLSSEPTKSGSGEESTIRPEEKEGCGGGGGGGGGGFFACYLLTSLSPRHKGQTYIGFTVNPRRRIRQHNGEISSGAFRTKKKRPWEMVLCIYGFPTNVSALQFEWAWQHPKESINVREAAATLKSISGLANKIKLAYKMLNLPAWNSLNMTVNIFSSKYTIHSAGIDLPKHMKSQICSMDELPCFTDENGGGFFDDYNRDELNGQDDEVSDKDDDGNDKDNSPSKTLTSSLCSGEKVWLTDETMFEVSDDDDKQMESQIYSMDELPCYTDENGCGLYDDYNHAELNGEDDDLSDKNEPHIREDDDKDNTPSKPLSSSLYREGKVCLTDETFFDLSDDDDEKHMKSQNCSPDKFPCYTDVTNAHENGDHDELNGELSPKNETHIREDDDGDTDISSLKISSSTLCEGKKVLLTEETFFELSDDDDDDDRHCIIPVDKTHEVDVIDLLSPSPETCIKKKKTRIMMNVYPHDIIDLTKSPAFV